MKIDLSAIDTEQFMVHSHVVAGQTLFLVQPQHIGAKFTQANKHLRSSVWDSDGNLVSAGFPKFVNWGENPDNFPVPTSLKNTTIMEKLDGSLLIVSKYKGQFILRTRGTVDASKLNNGHELELFKQKHSKVFEFQSLFETWPFSLLFEWTTPENSIVIRYGDAPKWTLVGAVYHDNYKLWTQDWLDGVAKVIDCERPATYNFPSVESLLSDVEQWKGKEGVCIYSNDGQTIHKVKGLWYLALHRMKEALSSIDKVIDVWFQQGHPSYQNFQEYITNQFDWELWCQIQGEVSRICDAWKKVQEIRLGMEVFYHNTLKPLPNRKEQAVKVLAAYGETNRASMIFKLLDGKNWSDDDWKKLLYQVLKK
jgi:hypothetical protein